MFALVTGGAASGKSEFAEDLAMCAGGKKLYVATMEISDDESLMRVERHKKKRAGKGFETLECPRRLLNALIADYDTILLECLSNLAANEMFEQNTVRGFQSCAGDIMAGIRILYAGCRNLIIVTNNIFEGSGRIGYDRHMASYEKLLYTLNSKIARNADIVCEVISSIPIPVKGSLADGIMPVGGGLMKFITGGAGQGHMEFAKVLFKAEGVTSKKPSIYDGDKPVPKSWDGVDILNGLHLMVYGLLRDGCNIHDIESTLDMIYAQNPRIIVTAEEIGCGPVPVDPFERTWREAAGRAACHVARLSGEVYRMCSSISRRIK